MTCGPSSGGAGAHGTGPISSGTARYERTTAGLLGVNCGPPSPANLEGLPDTAADDPVDGLADGPDGRTVGADAGASVASQPASTSTLQASPATTDGVALIDTPGA